MLSFPDQKEVYEEEEEEEAHVVDGAAGASSSIHSHNKKASVKRRKHRQQQHHHDCAYTIKGGMMHHAVSQATNALVREDDEGFVEYKWRLTGITPQRFEHLVTQMKFRVSEGHGQCIYELGVSDGGAMRGLVHDDFAESLDTVRRMAEKLDFDMRIVYETVVPKSDPVRKCAEIQIKKFAKGDENEVLQKDLRIAVCGEQNSGKSTLVGVLTDGELDDGAGSVRQSLFNHKHEFDSGRTSSISQRVVGFDEFGNVTNSGDASMGRGVSPPPEGATATPSSSSRPRDMTTISAGFTAQSIAERSVKLVTLMDLAGHAKYCKTAILGMTCKMPGYAWIVGSACDGSLHASLHPYISLCLRLQVPFVVVLTKADDAATAKEALGAAQRCLGRCGCQAVPVQDHADAAWAARICSNMNSGGGGGSATCGGSPSSQQDATASRTAAVDIGLGLDDDDDDVIVEDGDGETTPSSPQPQQASSSSHSQSLVPVFCVSCVTGDGVPLLRSFLHALPHDAAGKQQATGNPSFTRSPQHYPTAFAEVLVDRIYRNVSDVDGPVFAGTVSNGSVSVGDVMRIGPDRKSQFWPRKVTSIHVKGCNVRSVGSGVDAAFVFEDEKDAASSSSLSSSSGRLDQLLDLSRKGLVLVDPDAFVEPCLVFDVDVCVIPHHNDKDAAAAADAAADVADVAGAGASSSCVVQANSEPVVHCRNVRQAARVVSITNKTMARSATAAESAGNKEAASTSGSFWASPSNDSLGGLSPLSSEDNTTTSTAMSTPTQTPSAASATLRPGDHGSMRLKFLYHPEVLHVGAGLVLRCNRQARVIGHITRVHVPSPGESPEKSPSATPKPASATRQTPPPLLPPPSMARSGGHGDASASSSCGGTSATMMGTQGSLHSVGNDDDEEEDTTLSLFADDVLKPQKKKKKNISGNATGDHNKKKKEKKPKKKASGNNSSSADDADTRRQQEQRKQGGSSADDVDPPAERSNTKEFVFDDETSQQEQGKTGGEEEEGKQMQKAST